MAHPNKRDTEASQAAKLKLMTTHYGLASKDNVRPGVEKYKGEGPEEDVGYGADNDKPKLHGARITRTTKPTNPYATYKRGGAVKHRSNGGNTVADDEDIEQANFAEKADKYDRRRGGHVKRAHGGRIRGELGPKTVYPGDVKMSQKNPTRSSEPSPTPVDNRARGGRTGGKKSKGGTHVNIMVAPHGGQPPMAPPVSAMPMPPPMPRPPGGPPPGAGMPPGGMPPPGGLVPPGAMPPGAVPPGLAPRPGMPPGAAMPLRKRGGRIMAKHRDAHEDAAQIKSMVKHSALKPHGSMRAAGGEVTAPMFGAGRAAGGRIGLTAGAVTGIGRLEKADYHRRHGDKRAQKV